MGTSNARASWEVAWCARTTADLLVEQQEGKVQCPCGAILELPEARATKVVRAWIGETTRAVATSKGIFQYFDNPREHTCVY